MTKPADPALLRNDDGERRGKRSTFFWKLNLFCDAGAPFVAGKVKEETKAGGVTPDSDNYKQPSMLVGIYIRKDFA